ncbi:NnrS family protein [Zobellella aerophila]|uniref:NnrS family protein n=1 Tax=Zobellella aerophila TaxID=870480 RepID=A0ABP6W9Y6_9GAMM
MQFLDAERENKIWPLFRLEFRVFFLGGALFSVLAMALWSLTLSGVTLLPGVVNPIGWHAHEMIFGFALAIVAGFVLTAIQNRTWIPGIRSWPLALVAALWLLPQLLMTVLGEQNGLVLLLDLLWLPMSPTCWPGPLFRSNNGAICFLCPC